MRGLHLRATEGVVRGDARQCKNSPQKLRYGWGYNSAESGVWTILRTQGQDMALADTAVRATKPNKKPFKTYDRKGLFLLVNPSGSKL